MSHSHRPPTLFFQLCGTGHRHEQVRRPLAPVKCTLQFALSVGYREGVRHNGARRDSARNSYTAAQTDRRRVCRDVGRRRGGCGGDGSARRHRHCDAITQNRQAEVEDRVIGPGDNGDTVVDSRLRVLQSWIQRGVSGHCDRVRVAHSSCRHPLACRRGPTFCRNIQSERGGRCADEVCEFDLNHRCGNVVVEVEVLPLATDAQRASQPRGTVAIGAADTSRGHSSTIDVPQRQRPRAHPCVGGDSAAGDRPSRIHRGIECSVHKARIRVTNEKSVITLRHSL
mmetsp:Transcript_6972/g.15474  ORF Transcript_6972/g.15474 Transcript_6972/m.15474 type:complete len:283 (-) Transcript_6972:178-1026(-)